MGGSGQDIYDIFGVYVTRKTTVYRRANGEEVSIDTIENEEDILLDTIWVEAGDPPHYGGGAGESEVGDDDGSGEDDLGMSMEVGWDD